ncbi:Rv3235 family protein [Actinomadura craniellae]|uniref:Rv3235 family protein n=1 Tax=Actinomadura craniellae TaxID=2231787 RepID=UPI000DD04D72|nr:Rv3235 family protein [Actinomadura craniellae]
MSRRSPAVRLVPYGPARSAVAGSLALAARPRARRPGLWAVEAEEARPEPDPRAAAEAIVRLVVEVLAGIRAFHQLARRASPEVCQGLAGLRPVVRPGRRVPPPRVLSCWAQQPVRGAVEAGAVVALGGRVQALAVRLEPHRGRWRCTALETSVPAG